MQTRKSHDKITKTNKKISLTNIVCPITHNTIYFCPVFTCMWSDKKGGCLYTNSQDFEELASLQGVPDKEVKYKVRKGKSEIQKFLILNRYIEFVKNWYKLNPFSFEVEVRINRSRRLTKLLKNSKLYPILKTDFSLSNLIIALLCRESLYLKYAETLSIKPPSLVALTGIRNIIQDEINKRVSKIATHRGRINKQKGKSNEINSIKPKRHRKRRRKNRIRSKHNKG